VTVFPHQGNPVFVAIDTPDANRAMALAVATKPYVGGLKLGLEFLSALGPAAVRDLAKTGLPIFADTKFHDIPNTVAGAAKAIAGLDVAMFNVHASGGLKMMRAAAEAAKSVAPKIKIVAVTVLTSMGPDDMAEVGLAPDPSAQVKRLATLAAEAGLDGVVCSARELPPVRAATGKDFLTVVPGIRPAGSALGDQRRVTTPREALAAGADILVIGRPITTASDPAGAAQAIYEDIKESIS
jgi:orotidine-5'-phosphate decarboxylase